ncbi:synaptojanin-1 [Cimex lectularius]|uniref:phosphoinositide 5-phosphatase n=1 Tax=Cimex lectularius TaxID=79782 RepID=A0A8I6RUY3_CIMLE|nr:synaptojanin-1 [Cimex lectularius]
MAMGKSFRVFERDNNSGPYSVIIEQRSKEGCLLLESDAIVCLSNKEKDVIKRQYNKMLDAYGSLGILQLNVGTDVVSYLIMITGCISLGKIADTEVFRITQTSFLSLRKQPQDEEHISEVKKLLNSGTFYFSWNSAGDAQDITLCAQRRAKTNETDNRFFWNRTLHLPFLRFGIDQSAWLQKVMCGSVEIRTVYVGARQGKAVMISRLSSERTGTRFHVRGVNDEGHVANFVETEQAIIMEDCVASYVQTRGSVPLFWEQTGVQVGQHKVKMSRGPESSIHAFERHISSIKERYGHQTIVNLLGTSHVGSKESEGMLSNLYVQALKSTQHNDIEHIVFDYHQECKGGNTKNLNKLKAKLDTYLKAYSIFYSKGGQVMQEQVGTIRTNCLDCLDRTNCVQTFIGLEMLGKQLEMLDLIEKQQSVARFEEVFKQMWVYNGNEVSKIYAGTGAIQGGSKFMDGARSAARTIQNNLLDTSKQEAIDFLLLGKALNSNLTDRARTLLDPSMIHLSTNILTDLCDKYEDYIKKRKLRIGIGTYNVNGGKHFRSVVYKDVSLADWLLDAYKDTLEGDTPCDIYAIGFQELVDLNASNIMAVSSENAKSWAEELQKILSRDRPYILVTYIQLVGVCLYLFIQPYLAKYLKDVAVDSVKTGFGGATGNKGGVAIRCTVYNTSITFVCAHFAAGQSQVNERNSDYNEITRKITFPLGSNLKSQDYVIWCGDFNYRVDMDKDELKEHLKEGNLSQVLQHDQLRVQKEAGNVFRNYSEGEITFHPTYKYDLFSNDYDTSEKCRAPAWTDRVLWKRRFFGEEKPDDWNPGVNVYYGRAELKQSDHRPVIAVLDIEIFDVEESLRDNVFKQAVKNTGPSDATVIINVDDQSLNSDEDFKMSLLENMSQYGEVVIVRQVEDMIYVVFRDSFSALLAAQSGSTLVNGRNFQVQFTSKDWENRVQEELRLTDNNTIALCNYVPVAKALPPTRPPQPVKTPLGSPLHSASPRRQHPKFFSRDSSDSFDDYRSQPAPSMPPPPLPTVPPPPPSTPSAPSIAPPPVPPRTNVPPPIPSRPK